MGNDPDTGIRFDLGDGVFPRESNVEQANVEQAEMKMRPDRVVERPVKTREEFVHIGLRIPISMLAELDALGGSLSGAIRELLREALAAHRR